MKRRISMDSMEEIQIMPGNRMEEIMQNIGMIVTMPMESGPMCRDIGISTAAYGMPDQQAMAIMTRDVFVAVEDQEPRAEVHTVDFDMGKEGHHTAIMEVEING